MGAYPISGTLPPIKRPEASDTETSDIEHLIRAKVKFIGDSEYSLVGTPAELVQLIHQHTEQAKKQGFYMGCGVGGIHESNVEDLWNKCVAQLTTNHKGGDQK